MFKRILYFADFVGADAKSRVDFSIKSQAFAYFMHIAGFFLFFIFSIFLIIDSKACSGCITTSINQIFQIDIHIDYILFLESKIYHQIIKTFYVFSIYLCIFYSIISFILYYVLYGHKTEQIFRKTEIANITSFLFSIFSTFLICAALIVGAYLFGIGIPEWLGLTKIPGFFILQIAIISKIYAILSVAFFSILVALVPASLHPINFIRNRR